MTTQQPISPDRIFGEAAWQIVDGIFSFAQYDDATTQSAFMGIRRAYEDFRSAINELAPTAAANQDPAERRAAASGLKQRVDLAVGLAETNIKTIKQKGSVRAKRGLPELEGAVDLMKRLGQSVCERVRAGTN